MKNREETLEEAGVIKRTKLYNSILSIVKQIPRKEVEGDVMDASSCAYELEQLFLKLYQEQFNNVPTEENKNLYTKEDLENAFVQGALTDLFNTWRISEKDMAKEKFVQWFEQYKKK